jgi:lysophospholipid acyltransferase (LPLAT)-like uncharacterized protein
VSDLSEITPTEPRSTAKDSELRASSRESGRRPLGKLWKRFKRRVGLAFARTLAPATLDVYARSWRYETLGEQHREAARRHGAGVILALWHGRMLLAIPPFRGEDMTILVSGSEDGNMSEALLEGWDYSIIRGSSSRGGARALRAMLQALERGSTVVVTPDGPRGPQHSMNPGLAWMARATGFAVLPAGFVADRAWHLSSWDRYTIPRPRARVVVVYGEPLVVPRKASADELEEAGDRIRQSLLACEARAVAHLGLEPDP